MTSAPPTAPPPQALAVDEYAAADAARQHLAKRSRRFRISLPDLRAALRFSSSKVKKDERHSMHEVSATELEQDGDQLIVSTANSKVDLPIRFSRPCLQKDYAGDRYQWAVLYENQRGLTLFSIPYYSKLSLLPIDPYPFTIPIASDKRSDQPNYTLKDYPLPDGTWRWVSRTWMIDMQNDSGHVQHDGFEYNWIFQKHHWRAQVGALSAGGFVRRRRWIRLMMRSSAMVTHRPDHQDGEANRSPALLQASPSQGSTINMILEMQEDELDRMIDMVWHGQSIQDWWQSYTQLMRNAGRDGRKLEIWRRWLGCPLPRYSAQQTSGNSSPALGPPSSAVSAGRHSSLPPRDRMEQVLREHGHEVLQGFIYPDSKAQLLEMLKDTDMMPSLRSNTVIAESSSMLADFWSYAATSS